MHIFHPVSYTHLDVYKRQALDCTPNDILVFLPDSEVKDDTHSKKTEKFSQEG